jgi:hypothetical protein
MRYGRMLIGLTLSVILGTATLALIPPAAAQANAKQAQARSSWIPKYVCESSRSSRNQMMYGEKMARQESRI